MEKVAGNGPILYLKKTLLWIVFELQRLTHSCWPFNQPTTLDPKHDKIGPNLSQYVEIVYIVYLRV